MTSSSPAVDVSEDSSDAALAARVVSGELAPHALESLLAPDMERAVRVRRAWLEQTADVDCSSLPHAAAFDATGFYSSVRGACAEMVVGYVPLPVGAS